MGEDQLLDLTLSTTKINHSLHSTAVQMIKNVHFCAKIFTSKVQFRLLLHTQVTKNLKNEIKMIVVCQFNQVYYFVVYHFSVIVYFRGGGSGCPGCAFAHPIFSHGHMTNCTKNNLQKESNWLWLQGLSKCSWSCDQLCPGWVWKWCLAYSRCRWSHDQLYQE